MKFHFQSRAGNDARELYRWHLAPGAFTRLVPGWESVRCPDAWLPLEQGDVRDLRVGPLGMRWQAVHDQFVEDHHFRDYQRRGPFAEWTHSHRFLADGTLSDLIHCSLPLAFLSEPWMRPLLIQPMLVRMFIFRHLRTAFDLARQRAARCSGMVIAVTGSSGLIGGELCAFLCTAGHRVIRLVRRPARGPDERSWDPEGNRLPVHLLEGVDALVHLGGHNVTDGNWNAEHRRKIRTSRVRSTALLAGLIREMASPPRVFLVASGINYYDSAAGPLTGRPFTENSPAGKGFLPEVCQEWEAAAVTAERPGTRVVRARTGMVLSMKGGALPKLLLPNNLGLGAVLGGGEQGVSWIGMEDAIGVLYRCLHDDQLSGPVNVVAPRPVPFREFAATLARVTRRPLLFRIPTGLLRLVLGELSTVVTEGMYVEPQALERQGFAFLYPGLEEALRHELGRYTDAMLPADWRTA